MRIWFGFAVLVGTPIFVGTLRDMITGSNYMATASTRTSVLGSTALALSAVGSAEALEQIFYGLVLYMQRMFAKSRL